MLQEMKGLVQRKIRNGKWERDRELDQELHI